MLTFTPHSRDEIPLRVKWLNNKSANKYAVDDPTHETTLDEQTKWFDAYEANPAKKFFTIWSDQSPVGFMGLSKINSPEGTAELFIMIGEDDYRGKGIGKASMEYLINYAKAQLKLRRMLLGVDRRNQSAISLYLLLGFREINTAGNDIEMELAL